MKKEAIEYSTYSSEELAEKSRQDHKEIVVQMDKKDDALCLVVIGAICLIVAFLFLLLSFKRVKNKMGGIDFTSLQFIVCVVCAVAAIVLLSIGLTRFFKTVRIRRMLNKDILMIAKYRDAITENIN